MSLCDPLSFIMLLVTTRKPGPSAAEQIRVKVLRLQRVARKKAAQQLVDMITSLKFYGDGESYAKITQKQQQLQQQYHQLYGRKLLIPRRYSWHQLERAIAHAREVWFCMSVDLRWGAR